jgi:hypothetical protein
VAYVRTVKTASGALAVQIVHSNRRGSREIEHIGSAHSREGVEALRAAARQRLHTNQDTFDFGDGRPAGEALPIISTRSKHLWEALSLVYDRLGFAAAGGGDEVFRSLVLARLIEPTSKLDTIRVLTELGSTRRGTARSSAGCRATPPTGGGRPWRRPLPRTCGWGRRPWCFTTSRPCYADVGITAFMPTFRLCRCRECRCRSGRDRPPEMSA